MTVLSIIFSSVFLSNILLTNLVGLPIIGKESNLKSILITGIKTLIVTLITALIIYPLNKYLFVAVGYEFLLPLMAVIVAANVSILVNMLTVKLKLEERRIEFDLTTPANAVIIVSILLMVSKQDFLGSIALAFGIALGYLIVLLFIYTVKPKLDLPGIPKAFKGLPILLITLALLAMIFEGLAGIL